jgi:hypothetical protein
MGMTYDAASDQVLLFGGWDLHQFRSDTWAWNGTDWTELHPAHSPSARYYTGMAYDSARGRVLLFGGEGSGGPLNDTWAWNGTDWTQLHPAHTPAKRWAMGMSGDAANNTVVLFGGLRRPSLPAFGDTWTWNGSDWTQQSPAHSPARRYYPGMTYDPARVKVMLMGGVGQGTYADAWTWDGADWTQILGADMRLSRKSGPPGRLILVQVWGFARHERVHIVFLDSVHGKIPLTVLRGPGGGFTTPVTIPDNATPGEQRIKAIGTRGLSGRQVVSRGFEVT